MIKQTCLNVINNKIECKDILNINITIRLYITMHNYNKIVVVENICFIYYLS